MRVVYMLYSTFPLFLFIQATKDVKTLWQEETFTSANTGTSVCVCVGESLCVYCVSVLSSYTSMHIILSHTRSQYTPHNTLYTGALASRQALHTPPQQATVDRTRVVWNLPLLCRSPAWLTVRVCKCECGCMSVTHGPLWIYTFTHIHRRLVFGWFLVQWCLGYMYIHTPMHQHVLTWRDSMSNYYDTPDVCRWLSRYEV
jgi:hypothetical protein